MYLSFCLPVAIVQVPVDELICGSGHLIGSPVVSVQVFIRELISNASDALEKLRYFQLTSGQSSEGDLPLEIHLATDENKKTFTIQVGHGLRALECLHCFFTCFEDP